MNPNLTFYCSNSARFWPGSSLRTSRMTADKYSVSLARLMDSRTFDYVLGIRHFDFQIWQLLFFSSSSSVCCPPAEVKFGQCQHSRSAKGRPAVLSAVFMTLQPGERGRYLQANNASDEQPAMGLWVTWQPKVVVEFAVHVADDDWYNGHKVRAACLRGVGHRGRCNLT